MECIIRFTSRLMAPARSGRMVMRRLDGLHCCAAKPKKIRYYENVRDEHSQNSTFFGSPNDATRMTAFSKRFGSSNVRNKTQSGQNIFSAIRAVSNRGDFYCS